ncbi:MAG: GNAT family N-acetyltransferase [Pirellulales bacterium]
MAATPTTIFHLEMLDRQAFRPKAPPPELAVERQTPANPDTNRDFYRLVGASWNWTDRLSWSDDDWRRYVQRAALSTWVGRLQRDAIGYFELETQLEGNVEIVYFGLLPEFIGRGLGGPLLSQAIEQAWSLPATRRVWVHTCTDDHQHALANYIQRGFAIFKTERQEKNPAS